MALERRYVRGNRKEASLEPGLVQKADDTVWLVNPDGSEEQVTGVSGGSGAPSGPAGGDLAGSTYPNPTIKNDAITAAKIAAGAVGSAELADNAVDTAALQDGAVTAAKVAADVATQAELDAHLNDANTAHAASAIGFTPAGSIASSDVQAAIAEVAAEAVGYGVPYTYDAGSTTNADPGVGKFRLDQANQNAASQIYLSLTDFFDKDQSGWIQQWVNDGSSFCLGFLGIRSRTDTSKFVVYRVTSLVDHAGYETLEVDIHSSSAAPSTIAGDCLLEFWPTFNFADPDVIPPGVARYVGATSVADGGTITHGAPFTPEVALVTGSVAGEIVSVTAIGATTFTVAIKTGAGLAGTTQTVYWEVVI